MTLFENAKLQKIRDPYTDRGFSVFGCQSFGHCRSRDEPLSLLFRLRRPVLNIDPKSA